MLVALAPVLLTGCSGAGEASVSPSDSSGDATSEVSAPVEQEIGGPFHQVPGGYILDGYPEDSVPLYEASLVNKCTFTEFPDASAASDQDSYEVLFLTDASPSQVLDYYVGLMGGSAETEANSDGATGLIGDLEVHALVHRTSDGGVNSLDSDAGSETAVKLVVRLPDTAPGTYDEYFEMYSDALPDEESGRLALRRSYYVSGKANEHGYDCTIPAAWGSGESGTSAFTEYYRNQYTGLEHSYANTQSGTAMIGWDGGGYRTSILYAGGSPYARVRIAADISPADTGGLTDLLAMAPADGSEIIITVTMDMEMSFWRDNLTFSPEDDPDRVYTISKYAPAEITQNGNPQRSYSNVKDLHQGIVTITKDGIVSFDISETGGYL